jgi:hydroxyacid-oxoacid transhydrogenase
MLDSAFEMAASRVRFGAGVTREVGQDLLDLGVRRAAVFVDPKLLPLTPGQRVLESLKDAGVECEVFDRIRVEPNDTSWAEAIAFAQHGGFDGYVALGGGSTIDTAKAANLFATWPADPLTYVNAPVGSAKPVPGPLKPLIAIPTTAGTGSETTGVAIFDYTPLHVKTGISSRYLKPVLGILDPDNTRSLPPAVAASAGLDVLCHAIESYTAIPFTSRPHPGKPSLRPAYQGSNPVSDLWSLEALRMCVEYLPRAVANPADDEARSKMILASAYAGIGFGSAGVHLPHAMSYPVAGMVREFRQPGYASDHPLVPHGVSVILNAPAVFRFTEPACPDRHADVARILGADNVADGLSALMKGLGMPAGLRALGYTSADIPALVAGTMQQQRITKLSPRPASEEDLARLFEDAMVG